MNFMADKSKGYCKGIDGKVLHRKRYRNRLIFERQSKSREWGTTATSWGGKGV